MLDEQNTLMEDDYEDTEDDSEDELDSTEEDDGLTPEKETAEEVKENQKKAWVRKIQDGEKTLDDMPENLKWLKGEVERELNPKKVDKGSVDEAVAIALQKKRDDDELEMLIDDLENVDETKLAEFREEYEPLRAEGLSALKATIYARKLVGLKDSATIMRERRRKGMLLPPANSIARKTIKKDGLSDVERKFMGNLPKLFR